MTCYVCLEEGCEHTTSCACGMPVHRACFEAELRQRPDTAHRCTVCRGAYATAPGGWHLLSALHAACALLLLLDHAWMLSLMYIDNTSRALQIAASALVALSAMRHAPDSAHAPIVLRRARC